MENLLHDLRYGLRMLLKSRAFTAVAILSLALGIGANTTIFTLVNAVFLQSLPVAEPDRLMAIYGTDEKNTGTFLNFMPISYPNLEDYQKQNDVFAGIVAWTGAGMSLTTGGEPEQIGGLIVSGNYFDVLGVKPALGRTFLPEEDRTPGTHPVVVLGNGLWQRRFGANPGIIGQPITLNNQSFTVIGVMPEGFRGTFAIGSVDFWVPMMMHNQVLTGSVRQYFNSRRALFFQAFGRLKPGVTQAQAEATLKTIASRLEQEYPNDNEKRSIGLMPLAQASINPAQRSLFVRAGQLLMTIVGLVLLIACANVANLLLARASGRRKEIAIRTALGAGRRRLVRQLLTESVLLSLMGGALGLLIAFWGRDLLWSFRPPFFNQNAIDLSLNPRVLGFTLLISLLTGLFFGLVPALQASRSDIVTELKDKMGQPNRANRLFNFRNMLVVAQVALSLVALIGAGLFLRSLRHAQQIDPGFETGKLLTMSFNLGAQGYTPERGQEFYRQVQERVEALGGVQAAAIASNPPFFGGFMRSVTIEGQEPTPSNRGILTLTNTVGLKYFETMAIPLQRGRDFASQDRAETVRVAIINEAMARRFWPGEDPMGKRFRFYGDEFLHEVIGQVRTTSAFTIGEDPQPQVYLPLAQNFAAFGTLHVRTSGDPRNVLSTVRQEVQNLDRNLPLQNVQTISEAIGQALWAPRMGAALLALFGGLALLLAAVGLYGVLAYSVSQRTHEIGLRMALGAQSASVLRLILRQGMTLVAIGLGVGLVAGFAATRLIDNLLYGVSSIDPLTFLVTPLLLGSIALLASYIPARRASRVDPMIALRYE